MKLSITVLLVAGVVGQQSSQPANHQATSPVSAATKNSAQMPAKPVVKHVHVKLEGFELSKISAGQTSAQIGGASRGVGAKITLLAPYSGVSLATNPRFNWASEGDGAVFVFRLFDEDGNVFYHTTVEGNSFQYPSTAPALEPGKTYSWLAEPEVSLMGNAGSPAQITILSHPEREVVASALGAATSALEQARILTDKRLWYDAIAAYSDLIAEHPEMAELYEKRGEIYDQIPATQKLAEKDFSQADQPQAKK